MKFTKIAAALAAAALISIPAIASARSPYERPVVKFEEVPVTASARVDAPASLTCKFVGAAAEYPLKSVVRYRGQSPTFEGNGGFWIRCKNAGDSAVTIRYKVSTPLVQTVAGIAAGDKLTYIAELAGELSGVATIPASSSVDINQGNLELYVTVPAGQGVQPDMYYAAVPLTVTY